MGERKIIHVIETTHAALKSKRGLEKVKTPDHSPHQLQLWCSGLVHAPEKAKAQAAKAAQLQRQEIRVGEDRRWNERMCAETTWALHMEHNHVEIKFGSAAWRLVHPPSRKGIGLNRSGMSF